MQFETPLTSGTLIKRYKRFLADVSLKTGETIVAHCANSGSMMGLKDEGLTVWLSPNQNPKAKLDWRWEMVEVNGAKVGINTSRPNAIVEEAIRNESIPELAGYQSLRREVKYGENSRIDILLDDPLPASLHKGAKPTCYVEVKNVTLKRGDDAEFPDAVTSRGAKHLNELIRMVEEGHRAVMVYLVQREDCNRFRIAKDIDPNYAEAFSRAKKAGVEMLVYQCHLSEIEITVDKPLNVSF